MPKLRKSQEILGALRGRIFLLSEPPQNSQILGHGSNEVESGLEECAMHAAQTDSTEHSTGHLGSMRGQCFLGRDAA